MSDLPPVALLFLRPPQIEPLRYQLPLTPEELRERIGPGSSAKERARHILSFTVHLDALDGVVKRDPQLGLLPDLAVFRRLPHEQRALLEWGVRVMPVDPLEVVIREQAFAADLTPLRAEVDVSVALLTDLDQRDARRSAAARYGQRLETWMSDATGDRETVEPGSSQRPAEPADIARRAIGRIFGGR